MIENLPVEVEYKFPDIETAILEDIKDGIASFTKGISVEISPPLAFWTFVSPVKDDEFRYWRIAEKGSNNQSGRGVVVYSGMFLGHFRAAVGAYLRGL